MRKKVVINNGDIVTISFAQADDAAQIVGYMNIVGGESDNFSFGYNEYGVSVQKQAEILKDISLTSLFQSVVAKVNGEIISVGEIQFYPRIRLIHNCSITISVRSDKYKKGLGNEMLKYMIEYIKSKEIIEVINLEVRSDNKAAIALYKKHGFEKIGERKNYLKIEDSYFNIDIMEKVF